ncbi:MAG: ComEC/Rec2 family competence protein [Pirellulaceae bacterium]|nr:ComEC/Rec2 family competence protein [Pirellulaceae bacterium]
MDKRAEQRRQWREEVARAVHRMPLVPAAALVMLGIGLSHWTGVTNVWIWAAPALTLCIAAIATLSLRRPRAAMMLAWFALMWIGATVHLLQRGPDIDDLGRIASRDYQPLVFRAEILAGAIWRPNSFFRPGQDESQRWRTQWQVKCIGIRDAGRWRPIDSFSTLSVAGRVNHLLPGDRITVFGSCAAISAPSNPGENDLRELYRGEHQFTFLQSETADQIVLDERTWRRPVARLTAIAVRSIDRAIHRYVPLGQGPLAAALVFGQRQQVDWDAQQQLLSTGTLHMLAISGMHIELVAGSLWILCWVIGLRPRQSLVVVASSIALYALIAGANPPVLRAVFVVLAVCVARWRGRRTGLANLLAFSGLTILAMRSSWIGNVGVQLSFLAVATIALFARGISGRDQHADALAAVIEESWSWSERAIHTLGRWIWQMAVLSFWVWLMTAPLIWSNFHVVSLVAIPLNILLWPFLVVGLLSGLVLAIGWWLPPLAWLMGLACGISLWAIGAIVWLGDWLPLGHVWLPSPSGWWMATFYALAAGGVLWMHYRPTLRPWLGSVLLAWLLLAMAPWIFSPRGHGPEPLRELGRAVGERNGMGGALSRWLTHHPQPPATSDELRLTFIDVGHGTSVLMEMPGGEIWLYDAGHLGSGQRSHQEIASALWYVPTARIDRLLVSHADADHYNAIPGLIQRFSVGQVTASPQFWQHPADELGQLRQHLHDRKIPATRLVQGEQIDSDQAKVSVLHPPGDWQDKLDNANSLTLLIQYAGRSCLLPGDLEKGGLARLLAQPNIDCDVLMAPHHGSMTHDPLPIIQWCRPEWIVISGGPRSSRPQVRERYSPPGTRTLITHLHGAIQCRMKSDGGLSVWHWSEKGWVRS